MRKSVYLYTLRQKKTLPNLSGIYVYAFLMAQPKDIRRQLQPMGKQIESRFGDDPYLLICLFRSRHHDTKMTEIVECMMRL